ncbi:MAG: hypothetical protein KG075_23285 [Alphaproteobacteria bacterium]|nr:hypothetical protein [Alphaproteobacteria bacterium]
MASKGKTKPAAKPKAAKAKPGKSLKASPAAKGEKGFRSIMDRASMSTNPGTFFRCPPALKQETLQLMKALYPHRTKTFAQYLIEALHEKNERTQRQLMDVGDWPPPRQKTKAS